jgi:cytochrome c peroxidase
MKKQKNVATILAVMFVLAGTSAFGAKKITIEKGEQMFNDPKLSESTNESSCSSCHAGGKGLDGVESKGLTKLINKCLIEKMAGNKLDGRMAPMRSLKKYVQSFNE